MIEKMIHFLMIKAFLFRHIHYNIEPVPLCSVFFSVFFFTLTFGHMVYVVHSKAVIGRM